MDHCVRCARVLDDITYQKWRWTSFNFGVDIVLISELKVLSIRRHHRTEPERLLSFHAKRHMLVRITLYSINDQRQVTHSQSTDITYMTLDKNEEVPIMYFDSELVFPIMISVNILCTTPFKITPDQEYPRNKDSNIVADIHSHIKQSLKNSSFNGEIL